MKKVLARFATSLGVLLVGVVSTQVFPAHAGEQDLIDVLSCSVIGITPPTNFNDPNQYLNVRISPNGEVKGRFYRAQIVFLYPRVGDQSAQYGDWVYAYDPEAFWNSNSGHLEGWVYRPYLKNCQWTKVPG